MLDAAEYLHLAIRSSQSGDHKETIECLHKSLDLDPSNAYAIYLLAAEHAELGMFERAIKGMEEALVLDSGIELAQFQLGLLYARSDNELKALELWNTLKSNTQDESLRLFCEGLIALVEVRFDDAKALIDEGVKANLSNPALNTSMTSILEAAVTQHDASKQAEVKLEPQDKEVVFLGAYKNNVMDED